MAKRKKSTSLGSPMSFHEPSPKQELDWAMERAVEKAVLAHPRTQKLRDAIKQRMVKAAGGTEEGSSGKNPRAQKKP